MVAFELCKIAKFTAEYDQILLSCDHTLIHVPTELLFMSERFILKSQSGTVRRRIIFHEVC